MSIRHYIERFLLLTWKLNKTQWNRPLELLWLLLSPTLLCIIAVGMRMETDVSERHNTYYDAIDMEQSWIDLVEALSERDRIRMQSNRSNNVFVPQLIIAWAPNDHNIFEEIINMSKPELHTMAFEGFIDCSTMEKAIQKNSLFAGICFDNSQIEKQYVILNNRLGPGEVLLPHFNYTIVYPSELRIFNGTFIGDNWKTIYHDDPSTCIVQRLNEPQTDGHICYVREGFIKIQKCISENYLKLVSKTKFQILFYDDFRSMDESRILY